MSEKRRSFEQVCKEAVVELVPVLAEAVQDDSIPLKDRAAAFELLASNGYGLPVARSIHVALGSGGDAGGIPREQLEAKAAELLSRDIPADYVEVSDV